MIAEDRTVSSIGGLARVPAEVISAHPLRARPRVRDWLRREWLHPANLVAPVLVQPDGRDPGDYADLPTAVSLTGLPRMVSGLWEFGVGAVKLFCYVQHKTADAADALAADLESKAARSARWTPRYPSVVEGWPSVIEAKRGHRQ